MKIKEYDKMRRYELWTELFQIAEQLQEIADRWWEHDDELQQLHADRCNYGQLTLYEPDVPSGIPDTGPMRTSSPSSGDDETGEP